MLQVNLISYSNQYEYLIYLLNGHAGIVAVR